MVEREYCRIIGEENQRTICKCKREKNGMHMNRTRDHSSASLLYNASANLDILNYSGIRWIYTFHEL